ncbi:unnamed protein product, partial [marine sediment metagenome]
MVNKKKIREEFDRIFESGDENAIKIMLDKFPWLLNEVSTKMEGVIGEQQQIIAALGVMEDELGGPVPLDEIVFSLRIDFNIRKNEERPIENFITSSTSETDIITNNSIRVFDQNYAVQYLAASIGSTFEGLADSDIIYFNNTEYWVAPKTVKFSEIEGDAVRTNTELYDHVEGFLAMDTFNGSLVSDVSEIFNISVDYPIFFGESESQRYLEQTLGYYEEGTLGAYDSDILLNTGWEKGI